ncbi:m penetrans-like family protein 2 [Ruminococcus sp. CAG:353]|jgi:hypothetical protein|nr:hypothetical protein [Ruminococcus sp.]CDE80291.1 m penetrans-like family protein 2 [Ruminococcus sp. CAG:353]
MTTDEMLMQILGKLDEVQTDVAGLKSDMAVMKDDVSGLKSDMAVMKQEVSGLKNDMSGIKSEITVMKGDIAGLKNDVSDLKGDVRGIKLDIENDLVPSNKVALEMLLDHSKRFIKLDDKVRNISDSLAINEVLDELKSLHRI